MFDKLKHMRILLVDDDEFVRDSLSLMFESRGCSLCVVETAEEAMTVLAGQAYDLVITDYKLPGMDGMEFCRWIRKNNPCCMKILITAYGSRAARNEAIGAGIDEFIEKPITSKAIETSLERLFNREP
jgi:CheY-like chemotaxis protein